MAQTELDLQIFVTILRDQKQQDAAHMGPTNLCRACLQQDSFAVWVFQASDVQLLQRQNENPARRAKSNIQTSVLDLESLHEDPAEQS